MVSPLLISLLSILVILLSALPPQTQSLPSFLLSTPKQPFKITKQTLTQSRIEHLTSTLKTQSNELQNAKEQLRLLENTNRNILRISRRPQTPNNNNASSSTSSLLEITKLKTLIKKLLSKIKNLEQTADQGDNERKMIAIMSNEMNGLKGDMSKELVITIDKYDRMIDSLNREIVALKKKGNGDFERRVEDEVERRLDIERKGMTRLLENEKGKVRRIVDAVVKRRRSFDANSEVEANAKEDNNNEEEEDDDDEEEEEEEEVRLDGGYGERNNRREGRLR